MSEPAEARICTRDRRDGFVEISVWSPSERREIRTGMRVFANDVDKNIRKIKETLERAGHRVTFSEL